MFGQEDVELTPQDGATPQPAPEKDDAAKELRSEIAALRSRLSETENNAKFWYEKASGSTKEDAPEEDDAPELDEDLVDVLSSGDTKKVRDTFRKLGFVDEKTVQRRIAETRSEITRESEFISTYPDLKDTKSELFELTAKEYSRLAKEFGESPKTLRVAADLAAAKIGYDPNSRQSRNEDDEYEQDRVSRVSSQAGSRGRSTSSSRASRPEEFTDTQRSIIAKFRAVGSSVTEESYRKRAESGVRMGARNAGMRRSK